MASARSGTTAATAKRGARSAPLGPKTKAKTAKAKPSSPKAEAARRQLGYLVPRGIQRAYDTLVQDRVAKGSPDLRVSARVDPGILEAAARNLGLTQPSDVVNAAIIAAAAQDPFKAWFLTAAGTLPEAFELDT
jgi:hypothetical protein